jgi:hypothetical protein
VFTELLLTGRREENVKQLLDDIEEIMRYWKMKIASLDRCLKNSLWTRLVENGKFHHITCHEGPEGE